MRRLRIGTRGSKLAMRQACWVRDALLRAHPGLKISLEVIRTEGEEAADLPLSQIDGKGLFTKAIERALVSEQVDLAVHSLKDLPTMPTRGLVVAAIPPRADPSDALVARDGLTLEELPHGSRVLSGSLRRRAQLLHRRPDLIVSPVLGNVETRLRKVAQSGAHATVLASAGLIRLGLAERITQRLDPAEFLPACGQGALAVQTRDVSELVGLCRPLDDFRTHIAVAAERGFLAALGGGCHVPAGAFGRMAGPGEVIAVTGMVVTPDGTNLVKRTVEGTALGLEDAEELGRRLAALVMGEGGDAILEAMGGSSTAASGGVQ